MIDEIEPFRILMEKVGELATSLGLELKTFVLLPNPDAEQPSMVQTVFVLDPAVAFVSPEQRETDKRFESIALQERMNEDQKKIEQAAQGTRDFLKNMISSKGFDLDNLEFPGDDEADS